MPGFSAAAGELSELLVDELDIVVLTPGIRLPVLAVATGIPPAAI